AEGRGGALPPGQNGAAVSGRGAERQGDGVGDASDAGHDHVDRAGLIGLVLGLVRVREM
nr:hypothetical protein [Tanacetum cinerariifolium]